MRKTHLISVICCAHNEEEHIDRFIPNLLKALKGFRFEIILIADRCTDKTVSKAEKYNIRIIEKRTRKWRNSYAESLQTGYINTRGFYVGIVDVDIILPTTFFKNLVPMIGGKIASVAANVVTYPDTLWNRVMYAWERTYSIAPMGREPYGAARIVLKKALDEINGFRDIPTPDTDIDIRLAKKGYRSVAASEVKVYHTRHISLRNVFDGQVNCGRGRYALGVDLILTLGHALLRFRPFVIYGWLSEWQRWMRTKQEDKKRKKRNPNFPREPFTMIQTP